ncbi:hypothetical protein EDC94DRAFT_627467 [Helicostylum pulchrum]|nr:hypothetical protein EDC94DRAFT_627467 [Helicostylum pulchrum]
MRSLVILLSVAVSFVLATPSPNSDVNQEDVSARDPRESIWRKMKVALPDGYYAGEEDTTAATIGGEEDNTSQLVAPQEDLLLPGLRPLYKHQQIKNVEDPPYKHLEITEHINITPLSPSEKAKLNKAAEAAGRGHKKFMNSNNQDTVEVQDLNGVQNKKVAGTDLNGQMRYVDIPYYNRAST